MKAFHGPLAAFKGVRLFSTDALRYQPLDPAAAYANQNPKIKMITDLCRMVVPAKVENCGYLAPELAAVSSFLGMRELTALSPA